jgi:hypothetical protein
MTKVIRAVHTKEAERLKDTADQKDGWANAVTWYHKNIANPESDEHRENMLSGYPTRTLLLDIIDPNQDPPGSNEHRVSI